MVLRIEDTDVERSEARFESQLLDDLKWMGLDWDEGPDLGGPYGPYRQSDRLATYREHAERLLSEGKAYLCFCSQEELERDRAEKLASQQPPVYSGKCRALDPAEAQRRRASGEAAAIRLRIPEHPIRFHDIVHGAVEFSSEVVSDPIIVRSSGIPVYNYVVVVDDALMKITHVIRGDDHLSNTPKQVALYEALGWPVPRVRTSVDDSGQRSRAAVEAAWRDLDCKLPRDGRAARGADELSGAAGVGAERRHARDLHAGGAEEGVFAGAGDAVAGGLRHGEAVLAEPALHQAESARAD